MSYTVVGLLGRGGMAVVELAVDGNGCHVARKRVCLSGSFDQITMARRRIRREAEILSTLHHPGIVPLLAVEDDGADVVMVMPRMVGSLADRVTTSGPLAPAEVVSMGRVLIDALATAHRQGVIHRDIKPANVLFDAAGRPALADFGVAVTHHFTPGLTTVGMVVGTPGFLAPEQARGEQASQASDVFSLGATLAYALTGRGPFGEGEPLALMARAARGRVAPLSKSQPADLRRALAAMLDPRPERRPSAAAALGGPAGTRLDARPPRRRGAGGRWEKPLLMAAAILAALLIAVAAGLAIHQATASTGTPGTAAPDAHRPTVKPVTSACLPRPYQPCGQAPAPGTDGSQCLPGHADYDGNPANGCEAATDYQPATVLQARQPLDANLVPATAVDDFRAYVSDSPLDLCLGHFDVTLTAPAGVTDRVEILRGDQVLASAVSASLQPARARTRKPSCFRDNSGWLTIRVSAVSGQSAEDFRLTRSGSW